MPQLVNNPVQVKQWVDEKQALEVELAWELSDVFNDTASLRDPIRLRAQAAVAEMIQAYNASDALRLAVGSAWSAEYGPLRQLLTQFPSLAALHAGVPNMSVENCGQVVRLYGAFIEEAAKHGGGALYLSLAQEKMKRRRGFQFKAGRDDEVVANIAGVGGGQSVEGIAPNVMDRSRDHPNNPAGQWAVDALSPAHNFAVSQGGGIDVWRLLERDTVHKIDRVFGLMAGASISGTTTDLMFFMDTFRIGAWDPIYYLMAIAAIVKSGHHTILETALPLTLNNDVDYRIGYYTSLMPTGDLGKAATMHDAQGAVWHVLDLAEQDMRNRYMMVFYGGRHWQWYEGCYLFDRNDQRYRLMASADENMLGRFERFPTQFPTREQIESLMVEYGY